MARIKLIGRSVKRRTPEGILVNIYREPVFFISSKLISNLTEGKPIEGCDGWIEFDVPDWLIVKQKPLEMYRV